MSPLTTLLMLFAIVVCKLEQSAAYPVAYSYNLATPSRANVVSTATPPQLISKLLVQSPTLDNVYMDYLVTSKPLHLRKYNSKTKKTKKDSKIYFIPIPPLPYRYIPGIGYDYQPMKIKPIMQETSNQPSTESPHRHRIPVSLPTTTVTPSTPQSATQSKLLRVQHNKDYFFNGRPFRLQAAHADRKSALTPLNLKSRFYYNKNIIY
ncbi:uncharacterized protein LOC133839231 [Drosophila sulfurigaster albostrigata]|uniref:uncharacterized protein LOC133839231 n=1 Tax=Drosophila sulfurigaster albostrigata TaxID=89887 RepID=UPI002D21BECD|nr:uncharacterized protein LOC133839231 [Drosophila sulfurigaster albostrigata]